MARRHPKTCRYCDRSVGGGFYISARGLCEEHGEQRQVENTHALRERHGPEYVRWVRRTMLAAQRRLVALERERV